MTTTEKMKRDVLNITGTPTRGEIEAAYKAAARKAHPDAGGTHELMAQVNRAREQAMQEADNG